MYYKLEIDGEEIVMRCIGTAGVHSLENVTYPCANSVAGFFAGSKKHCP